MCARMREHGHSTEPGPLDREISEKVESLPLLAGDTKASIQVLAKACEEWFPRELDSLRERHPGFAGTVLTLPRVYTFKYLRDAHAAEINHLMESREREHPRDLSYWVLVDKDKTGGDDGLSEAALADVDKLMMRVGGKKLEYKGTVSVQDIRDQRDTRFLAEAKAEETAIHYPLTNDADLTLKVYRYMRDKGVRA